MVGRAFIVYCVIVVAAIVWCLWPFPPALSQQWRTSADSYIDFGPIRSPDPKNVVVDEGNIFSRSGNSFVSVDRQGKQRWIFESDDRTVSPSEFAFNDKSVFISAGNGKIYCLDKATGNPRWIHKISTSAPTQTPVLFEDSVVVIAQVDKSSFVERLDASSGNRIWRSQEIGSTIRSPAVIDPGKKQMILEFANGETVSLSLADGQRFR